MNVWLKAIALAVVSALGAMLASELVRVARDQYASELEIRIRAAVDDLVRRHKLDAQVRRDLNRVLFEAYLAQTEASHDS